VLEGEDYGPLRDPFLSSRKLHWGFDPAILHDWLKHKDAFAAAAQQRTPQMTARVAEQPK